MATDGADRAARPPAAGCRPGRAQPARAFSSCSATPRPCVAANAMSSRTSTACSMAATSRPAVSRPCAPTSWSAWPRRSSSSRAVPACITTCTPPSGARRSSSSPSTRTRKGASTPSRAGAPGCRRHRGGAAAEQDRHHLRSYTYASLDAEAFTLELGKARPFGQNGQVNLDLLEARLRLLVEGAEPEGEGEDLGPLQLFAVSREVIKHSDAFQLHLPTDIENFSELPIGYLLADDIAGTRWVIEGGRAHHLPQSEGEERPARRHPHRSRRSRLTGACFPPGLTPGLPLAGSFRASTFAYLLASPCSFRVVPLPSQGARDGRHRPAQRYRHPTHPGMRDAMQAAPLVMTSMAKTRPSTCWKPRSPGAWASRPRCSYPPAR